MSRPERLHTVASQALTLATAALEASEAGAPARRYVSDGPMLAWDCEQVVVTVESVFGHAGNIAAAAVDPVQCLVMRGAVLGVWVVRCAPTMADDGTPPPAAEIDANAEVVLADPTVVFDGLLAGLRDGSWLGAHGLAFEEWTGIGPEGGLTGGVLRVRVDLTVV